MRSVSCPRGRESGVCARDDLRARFTSERDAARHVEFFGMIGRGQAMQDVFELIRRLAPHARTALVCGETGTGKELVVRAGALERARAERTLTHLRVLQTDSRRQGLLDADRALSLGAFDARFSHGICPDCLVKHAED